MKRLLLNCNVALALFLCTATPVTLTFQGCASLKLPTLPSQASDQIILKAEQAAEAAKATFTLFVHLERDNESALKTLNPQIHVYAEYVRRNGINMIQDLRSATITFKANRTSDNQASLDTLLKTVNQAIADATKYINQAKTVTTP